MNPSPVPGAFVITGATSGLGLAAARALAAQGHRLILPARDPARADAAIRELRSEYPLSSIEAVPCDLASLASVREAAVAIGRKLGGARLAGLACNAGLQIVTGVQRTGDGIESTFAVNHLAHFLLTALLMPQLARGASVVFIGSGSHDTRDFWSRAFLFRGARYTSASELAAGKADSRASVGQQGRDRYSTAKLCNIVTALELARRIPASRARFNALDPGLMPGTGLARDNTAFNRFMWRSFVRWLLPGLPGATTAERSGASLAWMLSDPGLAGVSGRYLDYRRKETPVSAAGQDPALARDLFETSIELCGLNPGEFEIA